MIDPKPELRGLCRKLRWRLSLVASAIALGLGSCTNPTSPEASQPESAPLATPVSTAAQLQVVTTFIPITEFTKAVVGDRARVTQLLPNNVGPHDYQAKPADAQTLAQADVLVKNGLGMEAFLEDLVKNAANPKLRIIDSSQGVQTIRTDAIEEHSHSHDDKEAGHEHGEFNPHIWLDPKRAIQQVETIRDGLIAADTAGKETYTANAAAYISRLKELDRQFTTQLRPFAGKTFVTYHDFAPYFAQSYNLKAEFLVGIPEENASPADVQRVIDAAKNSNLRMLLTEPQVMGSPFSALAKDLNVQVSYFDPIETAPGEGVQPDYYFTVMGQNLTNLTTALGGKTTQSFLPQRSLPLAIVPQPLRLPF